MPLPDKVRDCSYSWNGWWLGAERHVAELAGRGEAGRERNGLAGKGSSRLIFKSQSYSTACRGAASMERRGEARRGGARKLPFLKKGIIFNGVSRSIGKVGHGASS